jgi:hypothetical protein
MHQATSARIMSALFLVRIIFFDESEFLFKGIVFSRIFRIIQYHMGMYSLGIDPA